MVREREEIERKMMNDRYEILNKKERENQTDF